MQYLGRYELLCIATVTSSLHFTETIIWTGVKKGPPRKMKFPETADLIIEAIKKNL